MPINLAPISALVTQAPDATEGARAAMQGFDLFARAARMYKQGRENDAMAEIERQNELGRNVREAAKLRQEAEFERERNRLEVAKRQQEALKGYEQTVREGGDPERAALLLKGVPGLDAQYVSGLSADVPEAPDTTLEAPDVTVPKPKSGLLGDLGLSVEKFQKPVMPTPYNKLEYTTAYGGPDAFDVGAVQDREVQGARDLFTAQLQGERGVDESAAAQVLDMAPDAVRVYGNRTDAAKALYVQYRDRARRESNERAQMAMGEFRGKGASRMEAKDAFAELRTSLKDSGAAQRAEDSLSVGRIKQRLMEHPDNPVAWTTARSFIARHVAGENGALATFDAKSATGEEAQSWPAIIDNYIQRKAFGEAGEKILGDVLTLLDAADTELNRMTYEDYQSARKSVDDYGEGGIADSPMAHRKTARLLEDIYHKTKWWDAEIADNPFDLRPVHGDEGGDERSGRSRRVPYDEEIMPDSGGGSDDWEPEDLDRMME